MERLGLSRFDVALAAGCAVGAIAEGLSRDLTWPLFTTAFALACLAATPFRRRFPFAVLVAVFGSQVLVRMVSAEFSAGWQAPWSMMLIITLPYALTRRANRIESIVGIGVLLIFPARIAGTGDLGSAFGATLVLLTPAFLGLAVRLRAIEQERLRDRTIQRERDAMAREIHDTVAHRLAAIAVQVQAARLDGQGSTTLEVIEEQSARALAELRSIVRDLRSARAETVPLAGLDNLDELAALSALPVRVQVTGDAATVDATTGAAIYRIAQESVTNALRHARAVRQVRVDVHVDRTEVSLTVRDDGRQDSAGLSSGGYGLVGMAERASLLGGSFDAGPDAKGGWTVRAILPLEVRP